MSAYAVSPYAQSYNQLLVVPSFGDIDAYARAVNAVPMLTPEQEYSLAVAYRDDQNNLKAAHANTQVMVCRKPTWFKRAPLV
jgi:RNA polymerase sigma-32 factor